MNKKSFLLLLLLIVFAHTDAKIRLSDEQKKQLAITSQQWADTQQVLDPLSLQLIGNFLHFSYQQTILDTQVCQQSTILMRVLKKTMNQIETYENPKGAATLLARIVQKFCETSCARYQAYCAWNHCNTYIEEHGSEQVQHALEVLRQEGESFLARYAHEHQEQIDQSIRETQDALEAEQADIQKALNALRIELHSIDPSFIGSELIMLDFALKTCNQEECSSWNILNHLHRIRHHQLELLQTNESFFLAHYKAIFKQLEQRDDQYQMILFSPRGLLTKQNQSVRLKP